MTLRSVLAILLMLSMGNARMYSRGGRDPLNNAEVEQMREIADQPPLRIKLMIEFAQARMISVEEAHSQKSSADRTKLVHDFLEDFATLIDELDDNLDMYDRQRADLRKPLKMIIEADTGFGAKLRALQLEGVPPGTDSDAEDYRFALDNAIESVQENISTAREMLERQGRELQAQKEARKEADKEAGKRKK